MSKQTTGFVSLSGAKSIAFSVVRKMRFPVGEKLTTDHCQRRTSKIVYNTMLV
jgi:hypothetical protein